MNHARFGLRFQRFRFICNGSSGCDNESPKSLSIHIWDSLEKRLKPLTCSRAGVLTWYACGPTVYDAMHVGHATSYVRIDAIRRIIERLEPQLSVVQLMGVTDIDDKIIRRARQEGIPWKQLSNHYETNFFQDLESLGVKSPVIKSRVTDFIPHIVSFVQRLVNSGFAYTTGDGSVYFDTNRYTQSNTYGKLRKISTNATDVEVPHPSKRCTHDFALWKGAKEGEPSWVSPWGQGRPGWHIECSVMASHHFGASVDVHSGGEDLKFPHHENEEAQCCAHWECNQWVGHWIHTGHLRTSSKKMSKSLGNIVSVREFLKNHHPDALRMFSLLSKYQQAFDYSIEGIRHAEAMLYKFLAFIDECNQVVHGMGDWNFADDQQSLWSTLNSTKANVFRCLSQDFDTPGAFHALSDYISLFRRKIINKPAGSSIANESVPLDPNLALSSSLLVHNVLNILGFQSCSIVSSQADSKQNDASLEDILLQEIAKFRSSVRSIALDQDKTPDERKKMLLEACDMTRERLNELGYEMKDVIKAGSNDSIVRKVVNKKKIKR